MAPLFFLRTPDGLVEGNEELFFQLTNTRWVGEMQGLPGPTVELPPPSPSEWELMRYLRPLYGQYRKSPPALALHPGASARTFTLRAATSLPKGVVAVEYLGEWLPGHNHPFSSYRWGPIDGQRVRNLGAMAEDGFPNLQAFYLYDVHGCPLRVLFITLEAIAAGEMLTVNYGMSHSVKWDYHSEYRLEAMNAFFAGQRLTALTQKIGSLNSQRKADLGWNRSLELENLTTKLQYLFHTPSALMHLLLNGVLQPQEVFAWYDRMETRLYLLGHGPTSNVRHVRLINSISLIREYFVKGAPHRNHVKEILPHLRIGVIMEALLPSLLREESWEASHEEATIWNGSFDAILRQDKPALLHYLATTRFPDRLRQACISFAAQARSNWLTWMREPDEPDPPLKRAA